MYEKQWNVQDYIGISAALVEGNSFDVNLNTNFALQ